MWVGVLLLLSPLMIFAQAAFFPVSTPVPAGADAPGRAIATMVRGIISFTRWPAQPDPMQFCLLGPTRMTDGDLDTLSAGGRGVRVTRVPEGAASVPASCDTLYLGTVLIAAWLVAAASGPAAFDTAQWIAGSILGRLVLFLYSFSLMHHMVGGLRHFVWDMGKGYEPQTRMAMAKFTLVISTALTVLIWIVVLATR